MGNKLYLKLKYKIDFIAAIILAIILLPFFLIFSLILVIELRDTPFIIQERGLTLTNSRFKIYKFRTIKKNAIKDANGINSVFNKSYLYEYVPRFCRWLRYTGLDELPQLFNVIKGEMSLIGPRPFMLKDVETIKQEAPAVYGIRDNLKVKPGITGNRQVFGDRKKGINNLINLEDKYDKNVSAGFDLRILLATIPLVFRGKLSDAIINGFERKKAGKESELKSMINI